MSRKIHTMLALAASATIGTGILMAADPQLEAPGNTHGAREAINPKAPAPPSDRGSGRQLRPAYHHTTGRNWRRSQYRP